jgi:hypothetical protein
MDRARKHAEEGSAMKATQFVFLGTVVLVLHATPCISEGLHGKTREDGDHRYLLEVTVAQPTTVAGTTLGASFCLSPAKEERLEVCLGQLQGHWFRSGNTLKSTFTLYPGDDEMCRCDRPVVLRRGEPACWAMNAPLRDDDTGITEVGGFVTVLEDVQEIGRAADSCINIRSVMVPITIEPKKTDDDGSVNPGEEAHR